MSLTIRTPSEIEMPQEDKSQPPRDHFGRPKILDLSGTKRVAYRRASSAGSILEDDAALTKWLQRMVAFGAIKAPQVIETGLDIDDPDDASSKDRLNKIVEVLKEVAGANRKAERGTDFHAFTEAIDRGERIEFMPEHMRPMANAYENLIDRLKHERGYEVVHIEKLCVNDEWKIAGTADRIAIIDGEPAVVDVKTKGSMDYGLGEIIIQLGAYGHAYPYDDEKAVQGIDTGYGAGRSLFVEGFDKPITRGFVLWVPQGGSHASISQELDLTRYADGLNIAEDIREWRNFWKRKDNKFREDMREESK